MFSRSHQERNGIEELKTSEHWSIKFTFPVSGRLHRRMSGTLQESLDLMTRQLVLLQKPEVTLCELTESCYTSDQGIDR